MTSAPWLKRPGRGGIRGGQPSDISEIREQPRPGMPHNPDPSAETWSLGRESTLYAEIAATSTERTPGQGSFPQLKRHLRASG